MVGIIDFSETRELACKIKNYIKENGGIFLTNKIIRIVNEKDNTR